MIKKLKHSVSIEQYLDNDMSIAEQTAFKKELKSNPELAGELRFSQNIDLAIGRDDIIDLRQKLITAITLGKQPKKLVPVILINAHKWWYAAASLVVLLSIAATLYFQTNRTITNDTLFNQYYSSENIVDQTRGDKNIVEAVLKFQTKDFKAASDLFKSILDTDNSNIAVWFYYGIANIETKNYNNSIKAFTTIINQNDNLYIEHAGWYLGLCYLKSNQKEKAIDQFVVVASNPDNFHRQEAKDILKKLQIK